MDFAGDPFLQYGIPAGFILMLFAGYYLWLEDRKKKLRLRIARATSRRNPTMRASGAAKDSLNLRRKQQDMHLPFISDILKHLPTQAALRAKLERAGLKWSADLYMVVSVGLFVIPPLLFLVLHKPPVLGLVIGALLGGILPYKLVGNLGDKRIKKFLILFPEAIEYIVRGLRSGLPVTESMNMVGTEMEEPIGSIFASIGESVKLGVTVEKALYDMAHKLKSTEFNFFVTSIILQRETGGNLSEILNNLAEVLRSRFMMHMKIKAMSSEAKASAIIVGALPFVVTGALSWLTPDYLMPLINEHSGHLAVAGAVGMLATGIFIMSKMTRFEI